MRKGGAGVARYKPYELKQDKFIPLSFADQVVPGSFEYALNEIVEEHLDLRVFEKRYRNDETGRLAYDPKVLLKIVLYGYSKGIISSRKLEEACRRNVVFMALSADTRPHFTRIAGFVAELENEIVDLFSNVLLYCDQLTKARARGWGRRETRRSWIGSAGRSARSRSFWARGRRSWGHRARNSRATLPTLTARRCQRGMV